MRIRTDVCRAVVITSLVWMLVDVALLFYFLESSYSATTARRDMAAIKLRGDRRSEDDFRVKEADSEAYNELHHLLKNLSFAKNGPGEMGIAVVVDKSREEERKVRFLENQFDILASDMVSINRTLPDYRTSKCREVSKEYVGLQLPAVSIIIVFHNEAWSTLLRTLHSVVNRSPLHLIQEIILIDDLSERTYLQKPLDLYVKSFPVPVHLVHLPERSGLIVARLHGAKMSVGKVLLFLDAHIEATEGWLEPLLYRVMTDRKRVVAPIIDVISDDTFEYLTASDTTWGGFNWHMNFRWYPVPEREMKRRNYNRAEPVHTPTIAGGLFAIDRQFFYDIGSYDEGMRVWGGENLEISFRVWMCGGSLEIHPCSRVGHVFRKQTPYKFPGGTARVIHHNTARTAEVWMDHYKQFFYKMVPAARGVDVGDLTERQLLRDNLQCKSFSWYLENIYPESPIPVVYHSLGEIENVGLEQCIDTANNPVGNPVGLYACHHNGGNQLWSLGGDGSIRTDETCLAAVHSVIKLEKCSPIKPLLHHTFTYDTETMTLLSRVDQKCLEAVDGKLIVTACSNKLTQKWSFENYSAGDRD